MFRYKDLVSWWGELHFDRIGGVELAEPTAWLPGLKPIRFTEIGCPAADYGANQPNVFPDKVSSEGAVPYFSRGTRDDGMQRRYLEAFLGRFDPAEPGFDEAANPRSPRDGRRMVDVGRATVWTWDARPYPWFPLAGDVWVDGANWQTGHWLNGRLGAAPLDAVIEDLAASAGVTAIDAGGVSAVVDGLAVAGRSSVRDVLEPLAEPFRFVLRETSDGLAAADRPRRARMTIARDDLAEEEGRAVVEIRRAQAEDVPAEVSIGFADTEADGRPSRVAARRDGPPRVDDRDLPVFAAASVMQGRVDALLKDRDAGRETVAFALPPTMLAPEPGDVVDLVLPERRVPLLVGRIEDGPVLRVEARAVDPAEVVRAAPFGPRAMSGGRVTPTAAPVVVVLDLPTRDGVDAHQPWVAAAAVPWPGPMVVHRRRSGSFEAVVTLDRPAVIGSLATALPAGRVWQVDDVSTVEVELVRGAPSSVDDEALLAGANLAAIGSMADGWEVVQFGRAELVATRRYRLSRLLRGQGGTEARAAVATAAGADFVLLDTALRRLPIALDDVGRATTLRVGPADRTVADRAVTELTVTPGGAGLVPLAPVHLSARRDPATGDVALAWIRRTRSGGDAFDAADVPLAEAAEAYEVTIRGGTGAVLRTWRTTTAAATYAAAAQVADFGAAPTSLDVGVRQISDAMGAGSETREVLHVGYD
ncbi:hypothetical protein OHA_1_01629 [Pleomorphomonas sp. SM30]|nr:hypothetical protein OHA_1_01629 [Pleomorphomonas sp. SM30]GLS78807.1 hypothetical protein GCM10007904_41440 [Oharaeibacter diazotrophicus]